MPFIPHTAAEEQAMLSEIGVDSIGDLFDEIPAGLRSGSTAASSLDLAGIPEGISEMALMQLFAKRAGDNVGGVCFLGAGCYDHHIPAAVWDLTTRGEFMTAYTPYQAEASQGTLQLIYEYQSMMAGLTGMDVSNASVYDGASGMAEAVLMALRANKKRRSRTVVLADTVHPLYRRTTNSIVRQQGADFVGLPMDETGRTDLARLKGLEDAAVLVVQQPNFFGQLEPVDALTDWGAAHGVMVVGVVNPLSLAVLEPPGHWGSRGADIACGDGQPLGIPMASGGPSFGFMTCRQNLVRQLPGRLIGRTEDLDGRPGFTLTLQAREQHIRRGKATSNICTNQGLLVTAATIHMSLMGPAGLKRAAAACHANTRRLVEVLKSVPGVTVKYPGPYFHESVLTLPRNARAVVEDLTKLGVQGGLPLGDYFDGWDGELLVCATEKRTGEEIDAFGTALRECL